MDDKAIFKLGAYAFAGVIVFVLLLGVVSQVIK